MSSTAARRERRASERQQQIVDQEFKRQQRLISEKIRIMKQLYASNPNEALKFCFGLVGREKFQSALKIYLEKFMADVAFSTALKRCLIDGQTTSNQTPAQA